MPKNKFQEVIFTIIMVFVMVYADRKSTRLNSSHNA